MKKFLFKGIIVFTVILLSALSAFTCEIDIFADNLEYDEQVGKLSRRSYNPWERRWKWWNRGDRHQGDEGGEKPHKEIGRVPAKKGTADSVFNNNLLLPIDY